MPDMMTVALVSQKGGAGKSTLALHLAAEASAHGRKALLVDLDPQGNIAKWAERRGDRPPDVSAEHPANLDRALKVARTEGYYLTVLDTAPHADPAALLAVRAADLVLVPCRPSTFDLEAIRTTLDLCDMTKKRALVVLNAAPVRSRAVKEAETAIRRDGGEVSSVVIRQRVAFQHGVIDGRTAAEFEPGGIAAQEVAALYIDVTTRLNDDMTENKHDKKTSSRRTPIGA
jgi:chromosome partitioning protein